MRNAQGLDDVVIGSAPDYERMMPSDIDAQLGKLRGDLEAEGKQNYEITAGLIDHLTSFYEVAVQLQPVTLGHITSNVKALAASSCKETRIIRGNSLLDGLTGLFIRKYFDTEVFDDRSARSDEGRHGQLGLEVGMARRAREYHQRNKKEERNLSLLLVDIDHFKNVNDTYGHPVGDKVLARIAYLIKTNVREGDQVFRYGGEEIAVIARQTSPEGAHILAEKLRKTIYEDKELLDFVNGDRHISASFGVANYTAHVADPFTMVDGRAQFTEPIHDVMEKFVKAADKALYAAKDGGRNKVMSYDSSLEIGRNGGTAGQTTYQPIVGYKCFSGALADCVARTAAVFGSLITSAASYISR